MSAWGGPARHLDVHQRVVGSHAVAIEQLAGDVTELGSVDAANAQLA